MQVTSYGKIGRSAVVQAGRHCTYVLPIRQAQPPSAELTEYLRAVSQVCRVVIADGSCDEVFAEAHHAWAEIATHVRTHPDVRGANGKVRNVLTALRLVETDLVIIADDDVRYTTSELVEVLDALGSADLVVPQNYFDPLPWHARWDTARILVHRATGGDMPGTLGLRVAALGDAGYDADVLFENLELMRAVEARGGRCRRMPATFVRRVPPTTRHFVSQRVRQAYDEFARPARLGVELAVVPVVIAAGSQRRQVVVALATAAIATAEVGRRVAGGRTRFTMAASLLAPLWLAERAVCAWVAVWCRLRGGVRYGDARIIRAANRTARLRPLVQVRPVDGVWAPGPSRTCG